jgi:putative ATP-binding cassette transporter
VSGVFTLTGSEAIGPAAGVTMPLDQTDTPDATVEAASRRTAMRRFLRLASRYWAEEKKQAWGLTAALLVIVLLTLATQLGINRWNRFFFDALDAKNGHSILLGVGIIAVLAFSTALLAVVMVHVRMRLQVRWRQWLTRKLVGQWLAERRFYQLTIVGGDDINPEYRIGEDTRLATEPVVDFAVGLTTAILSAVAFLGILWVVGGDIRFTLGGHEFHIPGYMVWVAILYSFIASASMIKIGRPLIACVDAKNEGEAQFRYELTRVRESSENIALIGGDDDEKARLEETFTDLVARWFNVIRQQANMNWVLNANTVLAPVAPLLMGAPKYLAGNMTLGELMQVAAAFLAVQTAFNWLVDNAIRLAEWNASSQRVGVLLNALADLDADIGKGAGDTVVLGASPDNNLRIENLSIAQQNGKLLIADAETVIGPGEKVLVKGESGSGKSTLIRAMAGLWPWGSGRILRPDGADIAFMPQRPYIPLGTLRHALHYPHADVTGDDEQIHEALRKTGLTHLASRLDEDAQWSRILSGGEQQRVAFARLLIHPPDIIIMDEATSALDELSQARVMDFLKDELAAATVLSVGHRPGLEAWHTREISLVRAPGEVHAHAEERRYPLARKIIKRLRRRP